MHYYKETERGKITVSDAAKELGISEKEVEKLLAKSEEVV